jgi:hypothetical protein
MSPFDAEIMALWALSAELEGDDSGADHGYRAALALRDEEAGPPPDPHEGLARLAAYGGARPVQALSAERGAQPIWLITDAASELRGEAPVSGPHVALMALGLVPDGKADNGSAASGGEAPGRPTVHLFFRDGEGLRAFALLPGSLRCESAVAAAAAIGKGPLVAGEATRARIDLDRAEELRRASAPPSGQRDAREREAREGAGKD